MLAAPKKNRRSFAGIALISALSVSGVVPAQADELSTPEATQNEAVNETISATLSGKPLVGKLLTLEANVPEGATITWLRDPGEITNDGDKFPYLLTNEDICTRISARIDFSEESEIDPIFSNSTQPIGVDISAI